MSQLKNIVVGIVALFLIASLGPSAITAIIGVNTSTWGTSNIALWGILSTMAIIGFVLMVLKPSIGDD